MTIEQFYTTDWHRGNVVKLENGKEYLCKGTKGHGRYLLLYSLEYDANFIADHNIVTEQVSDYAEPEEVYLKHKAEKQAAAEAKRQAEREERLRVKEELKQKHLKEQEEIHKKALARKAAKKLQHQQALSPKGCLPEQEQESKRKKEPTKEEPAQPVIPKVEALELCSLSQSLRLKEPVAEEPKKRVRQRIHITKTVGEKVEYYKKK